MCDEQNIYLFYLIFLLFNEIKEHHIQREISF